MPGALSPTMTVRDFENGYWYPDQLKTFAERIGIPAAKMLRKGELEKAIVAFLSTGNRALFTTRPLRNGAAEHLCGGGRRLGLTRFGRGVVRVHVEHDLEAIAGIAAIQVGRQS